MDTDVLVAGAGGAGLAASLRAAVDGRRVTLVDASTSFTHASNTAMSTAMVPAGGSRFQRAAGIDDTPERFLADIERKTAGRADPVVARALTAVAPDLVTWLHDEVTVPLELVTDFTYPGHSAPRCHAVPDRAGRTLLHHLLRAVDPVATLDLMVPLRLSAVEERPDHWCARLETPDGAVEELTATDIVLATNGYGASPDLVAEHAPEIAGAIYHGGDGSRGDALRLGRTLGLDTGYLDAYQGHGSVAIPHRILLTWATVMHGAVLVDHGGARFGDETVGYSEFGAAVVARPGGVAWMVLDERIHEACAPFQDYQDVLASSAVRRAEDVDELATTIGCSPLALAATLDAARAAAHGASDPFGRTDWTAPLEPPYLTVKVTGALFHTQGGLRVDEHARVLRDGRPVLGLYAAGGAAVGISGHGASGYLAGNGLLGALGLGYLAGDHIARRHPGRTAP